MKNESRKRSWTNDQLISALKRATSLRETLKNIGLRPTGGNYKQLKVYIKELSLDTSHLKGKAWNKGLRGIGKPRISLKEIMVIDSSFQSFKLKKRLFEKGLKNKKCEECGWAKTSEDGRLPLELDHINGNSRDNRLRNLRILCPNCHSLKPTHRGRNRKRMPG